MTAMLLTCCSSESEVDAQTTPATSGGKVLVAYFSFTNTTKGYAEKIAQITGGDLYEIVPEVAYGSENSNYYDESTRAYQEQRNTGGEQRPAIKKTLENAAQYDVVFLGSPIWYGKSPRVILTFLDTYGFKGKTVIPFVTSISTGISNVNSELPSTYPDINWIEGKRVSGWSDANLQTWVQGIVGTTGISETTSHPSTRYNNVYSLDGRRLLSRSTFGRLQGKNAKNLDGLKRGLYIIDGKKTIIQ